MEKRIWVPIWKKQNLTIKEAAAYSGIGEGSLRELAEKSDAYFAFRIGTKLMFNRKLFDQYIDELCRGER